MYPRCAPVDCHFFVGAILLLKHVSTKDRLFAFMFESHGLFGWYPSSGVVVRVNVLVIVTDATKQNRGPRQLGRPMLS